MFPPVFAQIAFAAVLLAPVTVAAQYGAGREVTFTIRVENVSTPGSVPLSVGARGRPRLGQAEHGDRSGQGTPTPPDRNRLTVGSGLIA